VRVRVWGGGGEREGVVDVGFVGFCGKRAGVFSRKGLCWIWWYGDAELKERCHASYCLLVYQCSLTEKEHQLSLSNASLASRLMLGIKYLLKNDISYPVQRLACSKPMLGL